MKMRLTLGLLAAWAMVGAMGCKPQPPQSQAPAARQVHQFPASTPRRFALLTNSVSVFWNRAQKGIDQFHLETGIEVDLKLCTTVAQQNRILEELISQDYNGIAISAIAPDDQAGALNKAAAKANLLCIDSDAPHSNRLLYLGTNNYEAGRLLGKRIVRLLPGGGKIAVFVGTFSADNAKERLRGIEAEIAGHSIEIAAKKEDNKDLAKARSNAEDVIHSTADIKLLCGLWSYNGPALAAAIGDKNKGKILAAVFDDEDDTLQAIADGVIQATVVQKPFVFGYRSCQILKDLADRGPQALPREDQIDTGADVIDAQNVKDYRATLPQ